MLWGWQLINSTCLLILLQTSQGIMLSCRLQTRWRQLEAELAEAKAALSCLQLQTAARAHMTRSVPSRKPARPACLPMTRLTCQVSSDSDQDFSSSADCLPASMDMLGRGSSCCALLRHLTSHAHELQHPCCRCLMCWTADSQHSCSTCPGRLLHS